MDGRSAATLLVVGLLTIAGGCASARYVMKDPNCGIVAIPANTSSWPTYHRKNATQLMEAHFPEGYVIDREEETVIGQSTHHHEDHGKSFNVGTATTVDETEYRIFYRRR